MLDNMFAGREYVYPIYFVIVDLLTNPFEYVFEIDIADQVAIGIDCLPGAPGRKRIDFIAFGLDQSLSLKKYELKHIFLVIEHKVVKIGFRKHPDNSGSEQAVR